MKINLEDVVYVSEDYKELYKIDEKWKKSIHSD